MVRIERSAALLSISRKQLSRYGRSFFMRVRALSYHNRCLAPDVLDDLALIICISNQPARFVFAVAANQRLKSFTEDYQQPHTV
mgnify:CR=1 FL=1|jgi:hypothetical protein